MRAAARGVRRGADAPGRWARANAVVTTFLRCHPMVETWRALPEGPAVVPVGPTAAWGVAAGRDPAAAMHPHHRRAVRRAERAGVRERPVDLGGLLRLSEGAVGRRGASAFSRFPDRYRERLRECLGDRMVEVQAHLDGAHAAGLLLVGGPPTPHDHLGGSSEAGREARANHLCSWRPLAGPGPTATGTCTSAGGWAPGRTRCSTSSALRPGRARAPVRGRQAGPRPRRPPGAGRRRRPVGLLPAVACP